ncbi:hypothetical protein UCREL1_10750 [Eutypa lata UCREL1]|uniref:Uncharacterized protein n=1 Tax=Eutypa lata (strain UCR-EL1) TaxID=1287681 RepID=M7S855_EUTLA|nr:hypothetical protein UCREL1_10750 [Eutypa lata UCREL1]
MYIKSLLTTLISALGISTLLLADLAHARSKPRPRPHPLIHEEPLRQEDKPKPAHNPYYYPADAPTRFFEAEDLSLSAPTLMNLRDYDDLWAAYGGKTRIEFVAGRPRVIRILPTDDPRAWDVGRHVGTFGNVTLLDDLIARSDARDHPHDSPWDHPWEGNQCSARSCAVDVECMNQFCSTCVFFTCR